jgi:hypothetical protein
MAASLRGNRSLRVGGDMNAGIEDLWTRVLAGDAISPAEKDTLLTQVESDPEAWPALELDRQMDGLMRGLGHARASERTFVANTVDRWKSAQGSRAEPRKRWPRLAVAAGLVAAAAWAAGYARNPPTSPYGSPTSEPAGHSAPVANVDLPQLIAQPMPADSPEDEAPADHARAAFPPGDILNLDFEDGVLPEVLSTGGVVSGPPRTGNRFCAIGGVSPWTLRVNVIALTGGPQGLLTYDDRRVLRFRYWVGAEAKRIVVQTKNLRLAQNFNAAIAPLVHGEWTWATLPLSALEPFEPRLPMQKGDPLYDILIMAGTLGGGAFYLDDIAIVSNDQ